MYIPHSRYQIQYFSSVITQDATISECSGSVIFRDYSGQRIWSKDSFGGNSLGNSISSTSLVVSATRSEIASSERDGAGKMTAENGIRSARR